MDATPRAVSVRFGPAGRLQAFLLSEPVDPPLAAREDVIVATEHGPDGARVEVVPQAVLDRRPAPQALPVGDPARDARGCRRAAEAGAARNRGPAVRDGADPRPAAPDEAVAGGADARRRPPGLLLHVRCAGRFPRAGARAGRALPDAHRDAADWRARRSADARRLRIVRPPSVLHDMAHQLRADLDPDGQTAGSRAEPVEAVGAVRASEVLPPIRAAQRQRRRQWRLRRRGRLWQPHGCGTGAGCGSGCSCGRR